SRARVEGILLSGLRPSVLRTRCRLEAGAYSCRQVRSETLRSHVTEPSAARRQAGSLFGVRRTLGRRPLSEGIYPIVSNAPSLVANTDDSQFIPETKKESDDESSGD